MIDRYDSSARPDDLIFRLRRLPRAVSPEHDLWPQIALRIGATGLEHGSGSRRSRRWRTRGLLALAASALLATVLVGSLDRAPSGSAGRAPAPQLVIEDPLGLRATADAMRLEYTLAAGQLAGLPVPAELREGIAELDRSAEQLEAALETDPGQAFLLNRLQHTYEQRLRLARMALQPLAQRNTAPASSAGDGQTPSAGVAS